MKATYKFIGILFLLTALTMACSNNEGVIIEAHDENRMMTLMHNMANQGAYIQWCALRVK